ncbi:MAG TPA: TadE/TadG family type IV pilus assembly protein [Longimicrobiales bacterium]|nr:TadE/TadG family type IV pilus assembly protein [Longimicrobiales bacterium]
MSARRFRSRLRPRARPGQSMVEFVLVAPLLLLLIFGLVEFARAWNIRHVVTDAAREGARYLAVNPSVPASQVRDDIIPAALRSSGVDPAAATIVLECPSGCALPGIPVPGDDMHPAVRVTITYPYELRMIGVFLGWALPKTQLTIRSSFLMRSE